MPSRKHIKRVPKPPATKSKAPLISVVAPVYNEAAGIRYFHAGLAKQLNAQAGYRFEIIYCNDGSTDATLTILQKIAARDARIKIITLSRNFGKEIATTAGLQTASGQAVITIDADGQHPVQLIKKLLENWRAGSKVIIGLRSSNLHASLIKRSGSRLFYGLFNRFTGLRLVAGATDFRLIDGAVRDDFVRLTEHNRITRGLIDWLGYDRTYVAFDAGPRLHDTAGYSLRKLAKLAVDSVISLSSSPLYLAAYLGAVVLPLSLLLGLTMVMNDLLGDPLNWRATGSAYITVAELFLIGILLASQGIIGLYLSHIHSETQNRPLYIIDHEASRRL